MNGDRSAAPRTCMCGHGEDAHQHWRPDTDCAVCGPERCARFCLAPISGELRRLLAVVLGVPVAVVLLGALGAWLGPDAALAAGGLVGAAAVVWITLRPRPRPPAHGREHGPEHGPERPPGQED